MGALRWILSGLFTIYFTSVVGQNLPFAQEIELSATNAVVRPGGVGQVVLHWCGSKVKSSLELTIDASGLFTFMDLPSVGDRGTGSAVILFVAHPFIPPGQHQLIFSVVQNGQTVGSCNAAVTILEKHGIESNVIEELRDSVIVAHINTGNIPVWINSHRVNVNKTRQIAHPKENKAFIRFTATGKDWDSTYVFAFKKQFYPASASASIEDKGSPRGQLQAQHQRSLDRNFTAFQGFLHQDSWQLNFSSWNNNWRIRAGIDSPIGSLILGKGAYSLSPMLRQNDQPFIQLQGNIWSAMYNGDTFGARRNWQFTTAEMSAGIFSLSDNIMPELKLQTTGKKYRLEYQMLGRLQDFRWHWKEPGLQTYARVLYMPENLGAGNLTQSSALVGASGQHGHLRWNHQSTFYKEKLGQFHNTQLYLNYGRFQWSARGNTGQRKDGPLYPSSSEIQGLYQNRGHGISLHYQPAKQHLFGSNMASVQYRYRSKSIRFFTGVYRRNKALGYRAQWSYSKGAYSIDAQGAVYGLESQQRLYQLRCSRSLGNQAFSISSSRRMPLQLSVNTTVGRRKNRREISGRVVHTSGSGIPNVVVKCGGMIVQTNEKGRFAFHQLQQSTVRLEIDAESLPFAVFPSLGYSQETALNSTSTDYVIACFSSGGVEGRIEAQYAQPIGFRARFDPTKVSIHFKGAERSFTCRLQQNGTFRMSSLPPGKFVVDIQGIGRQFKYQPQEITVLEGEITPLTLPLVEQPTPLIIQRL